MDFIQQLRNRASQTKKRIVLPRSSDERVINAARFLHDNNICEVVLLTNDGVKKYPAGIEVIDIENSEKRDIYSETFFLKRKHKGLTLEEARTVLMNPLYFAASMVTTGDADGCVAGSVATTGDVLRAAIQVIGLKVGSQVVSSTFVMSFEDGRNFTFGDCAVVPYPDAEQLATIAVDSAETHRQVVGEAPFVALLSFSTKGSSQYEGITQIKDALKIIQERNLPFPIDGELQFDAAYVDPIAKVKAPNSPVAGKANVFIFPNLDAGNIAYKITERLAGATATGPIIQGLAKPMMDLSRGCSWQDIVNTASVCALMSNKNQ